MAKIHVTTADGGLVEQFDTADFDLTRAPARQQLMTALVAAVQRAKQAEDADRFSTDQRRYLYAAPVAFDDAATGQRVTVSIGGVRIPTAIVSRDLNAVQLESGHADLSPISIDRARWAVLDVRSAA